MFDDCCRFKVAVMPASVPPVPVEHVKAEISGHWWRISWAVVSA